MKKNKKEERKPRRGPLARGMLEPAGIGPDGKPLFKGRVRMADGAKSERFDVPKEFNETEARAYVRSIQDLEAARKGMLGRKHAKQEEQAREQGLATPEESPDEWFERYKKSLKFGAGWKRITGATWRRWISPVLTPTKKAMRDLEKDNIEDVRDGLDAAMDAKKLSPKAAKNYWSVMTRICKEAHASKDRTLRVHAHLERPLCDGIKPPTSGPSKQRPWLYPNEWLKLVCCVVVPIIWRALYAIMLFTGLRPNELRALKWKDIDFEARTITVSKSFDAETRRIKKTKTLAGHRTIPIHPHLFPLLVAIKGEGENERDPEEFVMPLMMLDDDVFAPTFRDHLQKAEVKRARLFEETETEEPIDFRSLRDTNATWQALDGVPDRVIQRRLGHTSFSTTEKYIKVAEMFDVDMIGKPFPELPEAMFKVRWGLLLPEQTVPETVPQKVKNPGFAGVSRVARVGFEPYLKRPIKENLELSEDRVSDTDKKKPQKPRRCGALWTSFWANWTNVRPRRGRVGEGPRDGDGGRSGGRGPAPCPAQRGAVGVAAERIPEGRAGQEIASSTRCARHTELVNVTPPYPLGDAIALRLASLPTGPRKAPTSLRAAA